MDRRSFVKSSALAAAGSTLFAGDFWRRALAAPQPGVGPYGALQGPDSNGIQLPAGFTSRVIATSGAPVVGSIPPYVWHPAPDGGACFPVPGGGWVYTSNSEVPLVGGASAVKFNAAGDVVSAYRILSTTSSNCAGGLTPWGTWLSCEETDTGLVWECNPQASSQGTSRPMLGAFKHEAAAVDPTTGIVYLTEDQGDSRLYRFISTTYGDLSAGQLQAAKVNGTSVTWVNISSAAPAPRNDATTAFKRGEGMWMGSKAVYFTTTSDNRVWELTVATDTLQVLYDGNTDAGFPLRAPDNLTVHAPSADLFVAEDGDNMEVCVIGQVAGVDQCAVFARITGQDASEVAGPAFNPAGTKLYFSSQRGMAGPGITYEISGPFRTVAAPPGPGSPAPGAPGAPAPGSPGAPAPGSPGAPAPGEPATPAPPAGSSSFTSVLPARLLDTRSGIGTTTGKPGAGQSVVVRVTGGAVPSNATAVVLNVTGTEATADGFLTVFPTGEDRPLAANQNLSAGRTRGNLVTVKTGTGGTVTIFTQSGTHLVADVFGYYAPPTAAGGRFTPLPPARLADTRTTKKLAAGDRLDVKVTGVGGVPSAGVASVVVNITATEADGPGFVTGHAAGTPRPGTSNLNIDRAGQTIGNLAILAVGNGGTISLYSFGGTHLTVDVAGWFSDSSVPATNTGLFVPLSPARILDTREGPRTKLPANGATDITVAGSAGVPASGATGVLLNLTMVDSTAPGFVTAFPTGSRRDEVSSVYADQEGLTIPSLVAAQLGTGGRVTVFSNAGTHLVADVAGWYTA